MNRKRKILLSLFLISLFFILGYFRDFIFVNTNNQLSFVISHKDEIQKSGIDEKLNFLSELNYKQLYYLKWAMTILFSGVYFLLSYFSMKVLFPHYPSFKLLLSIYIVLIGISCISTTLGIILDNNTWTYEISRFLMGLAQSPVIIMLIIPSLKLFNTSTR